jgi:diguanylate cyclase (GGDEF)-like protein
MGALIPVFVTSMPLLVAAVLSLGAYLISFGFQFRRTSDWRLLFSYRTTLLVSSVQLLLYAGVINRWVEPTWLMRVVVASLAFYPLLLLRFRGGFQREVGRFEPVDRAALVVGIVLGAWMLVDPNLLRNTLPNPRGFGRLEVGELFAPYVALVVAGVYAALAHVYTQARGSAKAQAKRFALSGVFAMVVIVLDLLSAGFAWNLPPLVWTGTAVLMVIFMRDALENYRAALNAWRTTTTQRDELYKRLIRDPLTELYTRTHGIEALEKALKTGSACVVFLDLDGFKAWNDRYGHAAGDRVLVTVASAIKDSIRIGDLPARYAGDEFFVVLQDTHLDNALEVAKSIQDALRAIDLKVDLKVSGSIGVTAARRGESADRVINRADALAYKAKHGGKNHIVGDATTLA